MDTKLMRFLSLKSKLVWSKRKRFKRLTAGEELFESCLGSPEGERGILMSPDPEVQYLQPARASLCHPGVIVERTDPHYKPRGSTICCE